MSGRAKLHVFTCKECGEKFRVRFKARQGYCPYCYYNLFEMKDFRGKTKYKMWSMKTNGGAK